MSVVCDSGECEAKDEGKGPGTWGMGAEPYPHPALFGVSHSYCLTFART